MPTRGVAAIIEGMMMEMLGGAASAPPLVAELRRRWRNRPERRTRFG
jgi:hypothetical protein